MERTDLGPSQYKDRLSQYGDSFVKDKTVFNMGIPILVRQHLYTETAPGPRLNIKTVLSTYGDFHVKDKTAVRTSYL